MPRKTDSNQPADWLYIAPKLREQLQAVESLLSQVKARLPPLLPE